MISNNDDAYNNIVRVRLGAILREIGMPVDELSELTGMSKAVIRKCIDGRCIDGKSNVTIERLADIASSLQIEFRDLFAITGWCDELLGNRERIGSEDVDISTDDNKSTEVMQYDIQCVMNVLGCDFDAACDVVFSYKPVSPEDYSRIATELGRRAYLIMPKIKVKSKVMDINP